MAGLFGGRLAFSFTIDDYTGVCMEKIAIPIWEKPLLTLEESALYFNIGINKIRELSDSKDCPYVLFSGSRRLIKRERFEDYLTKSYSI